jgi:hypothetical protein
MWPLGGGRRGLASIPARARRSSAGEGRGEGLGSTRVRFVGWVGGEGWAAAIAGATAPASWGDAGCVLVRGEEAATPYKGKRGAREAMRRG